MVGTTRTSQESLSLSGTQPPPQPPLLPSRPRGMLGGLLGSLPPQLHKHLGLAITLAALQQLQDWVPCEERCLGVRFWGRSSAWVVRGTALPILQPNVEMRRTAPAELTGQDSLSDKPGDTLAAPGMRALGQTDPSAALGAEMGGNCHLLI